MTEAEVPSNAVNDLRLNGHSMGAFADALRSAYQSLIAARNIAEIASAHGQLNDHGLITAMLAEILANLSALAVTWDEAASPSHAIEPDPVLEDWNWIYANMAELARHYGGRHIAVIDRKVVASDRNSLELDKTLNSIPGLDAHRVVTTFLD